VTKKGDSVKIVRGALDEVGAEIILRGVLAPESLKLLKVADYQREVLPRSTIAELKIAFTEGRVPDIELGMRGSNFKTRQLNEDNEAFYLHNDIYIIDGLQRVSAAQQLIKEKAEVVPHLGAVVHFDTTEVWERERFKILNVRRTKLSPNVLARNLRHDYPAIDVLYRLTTNNRSFVLKGRVCWDQAMQRNHLLTATVLLKVIGHLHGHVGPGRSSRINELAPGLQVIAEKIGEQVFRDNVKTFFDLIDECWGIKAVRFKEGAIYLRQSFLLCLARILSTHYHVFFKDGKRLFVDAGFKRKLSKFPLSDPYIKELSSASGQARNILYTCLIDHINRGKRTRRLIEPNLMQVDEEDNGSEAEAE